MNKNELKLLIARKSILYADDIAPEYCKPQYAIAVGDDLDDFVMDVLNEILSYEQIVAYQNVRNGFIAKENKNPEYCVPLIRFPEVSK